jgi:hypothetical protein
LKNLLRPALLLILLAFACVTGAQPTFFSTRLVIDDRSQAALASAASKALEQVFVKVSGDEQIAALPLVQEAIDNARNMMSLYSYEERNGTLDLLIEFDEGVVKNVLRDAGAPYWSESRPPVLVWLVVDEPSSRRFATASEDSDLFYGLAEGFRERGPPREQRSPAPSWPAPQLPSSASPLPPSGSRDGPGQPGAWAVAS